MNDNLISNISGLAMSPLSLLSGSKHPMRVLIVEDEPLIALGLKDIITAWGHHVVGCAENAEEAIAYAVEHRPDIVLMDVKLGKGRDGIDAAKEIMLHLSAVVIFCTAYKHDPTILARMKALNPLGILSKPYRTEDLKALIQ